MLISLKRLMGGERDINDVQCPREMRKYNNKYTTLMQLIFLRTIRTIRI